MSIFLSVIIQLQTRQHLIFSVLQGLQSVPLKKSFHFHLRSDVLHEHFSVSYHPPTDEATSHIQCLARIAINQFHLRSDVLHEHFTVSYYTATIEETSHIQCLTRIATMLLIELLYLIRISLLKTLQNITMLNQICRVQCWIAKCISSTQMQNMNLLQKNFKLIEIKVEKMQKVFKICFSSIFLTAMCNAGSKTSLGQGWGLCRKSIMVPVMVLLNNHTLSYSSPVRLSPNPIISPSSEIRFLLIGVGAEESYNW